MKANMQKQVESWRQHNVYSEFNEPIRALYELLAGNALRSIGRSSGATEDRASTFTLSERFELDWIQDSSQRKAYVLCRMGFFRRHSETGVRRDSGG